MNKLKISFRSVNSFNVYKPFEFDVADIFWIMERTNYRAVRKFIVSESLSATDIHTFSAVHQNLRRLKCELILKTSA